MFSHLGSMKRQGVSCIPLRPGRIKSRISAVLHPDAAAVLAVVRWGDDEFYRNPGLNGLHMGDYPDASPCILKAFQACHDYIKEIVVQVAETFVQKEKFQRGGAV